MLFKLNSTLRHESVNNFTKTKIPTSSLMTFIESVRKKIPKEYLVLS